MLGRNPMVRMWMNDPDGDGLAHLQPQKPLFQYTAKHSYNVRILIILPGTQNYVKRVVNNGFKNIKLMDFVGI
jgi:hypothetical protein